MILQPLTHSEEEIMQLIWSKGNIYFRDLMAAFPDPKPHQNTVSTFLKILVNKNYLTTEKQRRIYLYSPSIGLEDYKKFVLKRFLENYFENSGTELLKILIDEKLIDLEVLEQFSDRKIKPTAKENTEANHIKDFVKEITADKKPKKKDKRKKKKK
ncbi:MAG: BlaI/MecI/CopY family transcriptional regulator [Weeksellaceae bacterium]|nr:BlaI/MecI/CopY family transcriptional regulator [Weeksellaceae bacterium]